MAWEEDLRPMSSHSTNRYFIPNWGIQLTAEAGKKPTLLWKAI